MTELTLDEWFQIWAADKTARALGLSMTREKSEHGVIIGMSKKKEKTLAKTDKKLTKRLRTRRGGKGGGDGLNISRRTPYLT